MALVRLIHYLRNPQRSIRVAAFNALTDIQIGCPGTPDEPQLWEKWLEDVANASPPRSPLPARPMSTGDAAKGILKAPHRSYSRVTDSTEIAKHPALLADFKSLIELLHHTNATVRKVAFDTMTSLQPDRPGTVDDVIAWEDWFHSIERLAKPTKEVKGDNSVPTDDAVADIVWIRVNVPWTSKSKLARDKVGREALQRLVSYLSHNDKSVRSAADRTLRNLQEDNSPRTVEDWQKWLKGLDADKQQLNSGNRDEGSKVMQ
jgi:hypothetical protein